MLRTILLAESSTRNFMAWGISVRMELPRGNFTGELHRRNSMGRLFHAGGTFHTGVSVRGANSS